VSFFRTHPLRTEKLQNFEPRPSGMTDAATTAAGAIGMDWTAARVRDASGQHCH